MGCGTIVPHGITRRMFDTTPNAQQSGSSAQPENAPVSFETLDYGATAIEAGKLKPITPDSVKDTGVPGDDVGSYEFQAPHAQSKWMMIIFIILAVAALAGLAWWAYNAYATSNGNGPEVVVPANTETTPAQENAPTDERSPFDEVIPTQTATTTPEAPVVTPEQEQPPNTAALDTDGDGLSDGEEVLLGSDPRSKDSDEDGLTDWEEVKIYGTSPTNPDSDGDTYLDGTEVHNGYNPKGTGPLLGITATSTSSVAQ